jgi:hypothetical protein
MSEAFEVCTSYVQKNLAHIPNKTNIDYQKEMEKNMEKPSIASRKANKEILEHQVRLSPCQLLICNCMVSVSQS